MRLRVFFERLTKGGESPFEAGSATFTPADRSKAVAETGLSRRPSEQPALFHELISGGISCGALTFDGCSVELSL